MDIEGSRMVAPEDHARAYDGGRQLPRRQNSWAKRQGQHHSFAADKSTHGLGYDASRGDQGAREFCDLSPSLQPADGNSGPQGTDLQQEFFYEMVVNCELDPQRVCVNTCFLNLSFKQLSRLLGSIAILKKSSLPLGI